MPRTFAMLSALALAGVVADGCARPEKRPETRVALAPPPGDPPCHTDRMIDVRAPERAPRGPLRLLVMMEPDLVASLHWRPVGTKGWNEIRLEGGDGCYLPTLEMTDGIEFWLEAYGEHGCEPCLEASPEAPRSVAVQ